MKQYQPVEILIMSLKPQDVVTLSGGGQYSADLASDKLDFGAPQYE